MRSMKNTPATLRKLGIDERSDLFEKPAWQNGKISAPWNIPRMGNWSRILIYSKAWTVSKPGKKKPDKINDQER